MVTASAARGEDVVRRICLIAIVITVLIGFASFPAEAQTARIFYIDYASGSNSNNGTANTAPWKTHPFMQANGVCTGSGSAPSYSHQAGDRFIFKGGVTWPTSCFGMAISQGGSSDASHDYYGVDQSWFAGSQWSRPVFDMQNSAPAGGRAVPISAPNVTIDNIEMKNLFINAGSTFDASLIQATYVTGILIQNVYLHGWKTNSATDDQMGGITSVGSNITVDNSTVSNVEGKVSGKTVGACIFNAVVVTNSVLHDCSEGLYGGNIVHDNQIFNIGPSFDANYHENALETNGQATIYNNVVYNCFHGTCIYPNPGFGSGTVSVFNNVVFNSTVPEIQFDLTYVASGNVVDAVVYNNTSQASGALNLRVVGRSVPLRSLTYDNNHWINDGITVSIDPPGSVSTVKSGTHNVTQSNSAATSQGYTAANKFAPSGSGGATVKTATSLSVLCSGLLNPLCSDVLHDPRLASWDVGAYQFGGQSSATPNPPSNLAAIVQ